MLNKKYTIGVDIGGTNMKAVLFDEKKVTANFELATPKDSLDHFLIMINALVEPLITKAKKNKAEILGAGFSIAGVPNKERRLVLKSPNITIIENAPLADLIEKKINMPIKLDNDAKCFLRAEIKMGAVKNFQNVFGLIVGTGIGGAWWHNNEIYYGANSAAGELGHTIIDFINKADVEAVYQKLNQNNPAKLADEAYRGDNLAEKTYEEIGELTGVALANIVNILDPEAIVIGGGVAGSDDLFFPEIKKAAKQYIINPEAKNIKILKSKLGYHAGAIGAALLIE